VASEIEAGREYAGRELRIGSCAKLVEGAFQLPPSDRLTTVRQALPDGTETANYILLGDIVLGGVVARAIRCAGWRRIKLAGFPQPWRAPCSVPQASIPTAWCCDGAANRPGRRGLKQTLRRGV